MTTVAGPPLARVIPVSATLTANEAMAARRRRGLPVLPLGFGEAGLPVHPMLREALAAASGANGYGPVAGHLALRQAAAGYWARRGLPTGPGQVVCGPGSKPLLFALLLAIGGDVALPQPCWVSYAAQATLICIRANFVPTSAGEGEIPDPAALAAAAAAAARAGQPIRSVLVTLPDNPTGRLASPATVGALCEVASAHGLIIVCDEIYRDLIHDPAAPVLSPAQAAPERTVTTTGLSKNLALGGWRIGVARMPPGPLGHRLRRALLGAGSEIWSAPAAPVQHAAALGFAEPPPIRARIAASRILHAAVAGAVAAVCAAAGLVVAPPQGGFYVYPVDQVQTDNGQEFGSAFHWHLTDKAIGHIKIKPRTPQLNGKVLQPNHQRRVPLRPRLDVRKPATGCGERVEHPLQLPSPAQRCWRSATRVASSGSRQQRRGLVQLGR
jgi:aspartate aminotransferase